MAQWPKPSEIAVVNVNGTDYTDWETVMVRHSLKDFPHYHCRFTCSENMPMAANFAAMQIKPGDKCSITLAGQPAFNGFVETRQVFFNAHRHMVEIQAATNMELATSSVVHPTMEWKNKTFQQIGQDVLGRLDINLKFEGGSPPSQTFDRVSAMHSESVHDFLDVLARSLTQETGKAIAFTSNTEQDFVVTLGPSGGGDTVTEGVDIIEGREIIYNPTMAGKFPAISQGAGDDQNNATKVTSEPFFQNQALGGTFVPKNIAGTIISEIPTFNKKMLQGRVTSESGWTSDDQITVFATVYGWLRPSGGLWYRNQNVSVISPMLMMKGNEGLTAKSVTFTQDNNSGTRTVLELCNPAALRGLTPEIQ